MRPRLEFKTPIFLVLTLCTTLGCIAELSCAAGAMQQKMEPRLRKFAPSANVQYELQGALIDAIPGDIIELAAGIYHLDQELSIACDRLTIRGAGHEKTILSFAGQVSGSSGIHATGNQLLLQGLAVEDTAGNAIKVLGATDVTLRGVRAQWTAGPKTSNGAYGIYPVECQNVLIEDCVAVGASDAGIYVGQSENVVVRNCVARQNVAGIEIENTSMADVYNNHALENTGGILVFDLPGLKKAEGNNVRVFSNEVTDNNHPNFAAKGGAVAAVPPGTGIMLMATDEVEIFDNEITNNHTASILLISYFVAQKKFDANQFDPVSNLISIHHNRIHGGGKQPKGLLAEMLIPFFNRALPDILFDGIDADDGDEERRISIYDNGEATFANFNLDDLTPAKLLTGQHQIETDLADYATKLPTLEPVALPPHRSASADDQPAASTVYRAAPRSLDQWDIYVMNGRQWEVQAGWLPYELNTALFSDHTLKQRLIRLPEGQSMEWHGQDPLQFPVGTVIAKTFAYPDPANDPTPGIRFLETRIEVLKDSGWYGFSYQWNEAQTAAELKLGGAAIDVSWIDQQGQRVENRYEIPNANQCLVCHNRDGQFVPIGPTVRNLNRSQAEGGMNQLHHWVDSGALHGAPPQGQWNRLPDAYDEQTGSLSKRARAWLEVNCAHCHNPSGTAGSSGLDLRTVQTDPRRFGVFKSPVAAGQASGNRDYDIVPGHPDDSILMFRVESEDVAIRMPNIARTMTDERAVALLRDWIAEMEQ